jgi:hypothetical protein
VRDPPFIEVRDHEFALLLLPLYYSFVFTVSLVILLFIVHSQKGFATLPLE